MLNGEWTGKRIMYKKSRARIVGGSIGLRGTTWRRFFCVGLTGLVTGVGFGFAHGLPPACAADAHGATGEAVSIQDMTVRVDDLQAVVHMEKCDLKELEKIGADFGRTYQFQDLLKNVTLQYKQPDKMRIAGTGFVKASIVMNGPLRSFRTPFQPKKVEDLTESPGKRQSLLEYGGLLAPATLNYMQAKFVRQDTLDGQTTPVFDLTYKGATSGSHYRVWFDPHTHVTLKREWYGFDGKLKATFYYQDVHEVGASVWLPSQVEVRNAEGVSAAITTINSVKINQGLGDDIFTITPEPSRAHLLK